MEVEKKLLHRKAGDVVQEEAIAAPVKKAGPAFRILGPEGFEGAQVLGVYAGGILDLDGEQAERAVKHEIHLRSRPGPPVGERTVGISIRQPGAQVLGHQSFQRLALHLLGAIQRAGRAQRSENSAVEKVELGMGNQLAPGAAGEDGQPPGEKKVLQNGEISLHGLAFHGAFPRHVADAKHAGMGETDRLQKAGKRPHAADQPFGHDLFFHVEGGIGPEHFGRPVGGKDDRQHAQAEGIVQAEALLELRGHEGVEVFQDGAARQQIRPGSFQFARGRSGHDEGRMGFFLNQAMHHGEKPGDFLHLIQDDGFGAGLAGDQAAQPRRVGGER